MSAEVGETNLILTRISRALDGIAAVLERLLSRTDRLERFLDRDEARLQRPSLGKDKDGP
jgi:hypothetical protein